jgi:hypothetical protein
MSGSLIPTSSILGKIDHLVHIAPFPYVAIEEALPWPLYDKLSKEFPENEILNREYGENQRVDLHAKDSAGRVSPQWRQFIDYHTSVAFWHDMARVFGDVIRLVYPSLEIRHGEMTEWDTVVRGMGQGTVNMECQPGVNTPQTEAGRVRGPHLDNPIELIAGLLYMGEGEGDLEVCRMTKQPMWHGKLEIEDNCVEVVSKVKYRPNMLVMFLNSPISIHSVTPRQPTTECRRLCNFAAEMNSPLFKIGHGRY